MAIEYLGLSAINGPMVVLEGISGAAYDEIVEMTVDGKKRKLGRIIEVYEDKAVIQVFEGTEGMGLKNVHTRLTGHPMELGVSTEMLGRTMNGIGVPIDGLGEILPEKMLDVNGKPLNPVTREYPRNYIRTGISAIDGLMTLIRGQKLPIFSGNGLPHDQLAAQIVRQASLGDDSDEQFAIVFAAMGVKHDVAEFFRRTFEERGRVELARAAEVGHGALERQARAGGHLLEDHAQRLMFQQLGVVPGLHAALEHARQLDHVEQLVLREIVGIEKILDGHRKASFESELNGQPVVAAAPARCGEDKPARPDCSTAAPCPQL